MATEHQQALVYSQNLFDIASAEQKQTVHFELQDIREILSEIPDLLVALDEMETNSSEQLQIIDSLLMDKSKLTTNLIYLLRDNKAFSLLPTIIEQFEEMFLNETSQLIVEVLSVTPLNKSQKDRLEKFYEQKMKRQKVQIENKIDRSIIGGLVIKTTTTEFDASLKNKLSLMNKKLQTNQKEVM